MESAISSLILFTVGIYAALTLSHAYLENQELLFVTEQAHMAQAQTRARTQLTIQSAEILANGSQLVLKVRNSGHTKLADFDRWDLIVEYYSEPDYWLPPQPYDYNVRWLPYTPSAPVNGEWTVTGLYSDVQTLRVEAFDPGILNPDEEMVIHAQLTPSVALTTTNRILLNTPNGISATAHFLR